MELEGGGTPSKDEQAGRQKRGRKPGQRRRTPLEQARDRRLITRLRLRNMLLTQEEIAEEVNKAYETPEQIEQAKQEGKIPPHVSDKMVSHILREFEKRLEAEATDDVLALRRLRIAELRELEVFCWERYHATLAPQVTKLDETKDGTGKDADGTTTTHRTTTVNRDGDRGYLELALKCKQEIIDLENIRPPRKTALTNPEGTKPFDAFGDSEELKRLNSLFTEIVGGKAGDMDTVKGKLTP